MPFKSLSLVVDMFGCPNRCKHCWLGHMPNIQMEENADVWILNCFQPYFDNIAYYSWLREPDYCDDYQKRWERDNQLSINIKPRRFELASFYKLVRDPKYVDFLKSVNTKTVQLTLFGLETTTDKYVGRKNAYFELLKATEILIENEITPRWQAFINEENKDELVQLLDVIKEKKYEERCLKFGGNFKFFVHEGSCDGENRKLYSIRIQKENIPQELIPYYLDYDEILTEKECIESLMNNHEKVQVEIDDNLVLNISNTYDVYFNFTHLSDEWKIGNLKEDEISEIMRRIIEKDTYALKQANTITYKELALEYGNDTNKVFSLDDYKNYLFNCYLERNKKGNSDS